MFPFYIQLRGEKLEVRVTALALSALRSPLSTRATTRSDYAC